MPYAWKDIDFAHILGDFMKFGVYKREKAPFVFTEYGCSNL